MRRIIIIGYMGAGKTTVGKALSKELNIPFYDLDWYIESHEVAEFENVIISCGGGTPCFYDNMDYLNAQGDTVYLKASPEVLYGHLKIGKTERPLLKNKTPEEMQEYIREQLDKREQYYLQAKHVLDVNLMDNYEKIKISVAKLRELLNL